MSNNDIECPICLGVLYDSPYAKIDNNKEQGNYHIECLEGWFNRCQRGILCQDRVQSYSIYHDNILLEKIILPSPRNNTNNINNQNNQTRRNRTNDDVECCLCTII